MAVDLHVGGAFRTAVDEFLESLISWSVARCGVDEFVRAKEEFYHLMGKVFYDDENYHHRMQYFLDYFLFERTPEDPRRGNTPMTPFEFYLKQHPEALIGGFTHSLFRVHKLYPNAMLLKDLLAEQKFRIQKQEEEIFKGISKGDVFQGFIFHLREHSVLSRGLIFHPIQAHRLLQKSLKEEQKRSPWSPPKTLARFARQQLKHARLKHVDPKLVYSES